MNSGEDLINAWTHTVEKASIALTLGNTRGCCPEKFKKDVTHLINVINNTLLGKYWYKKQELKSSALGFVELGGGQQHMHLAVSFYYETETQKEEKYKIIENKARGTWKKINGGHFYIESIKDKKKYYGYISKSIKDTREVDPYYYY